MDRLLIVFVDALGPQQWASSRALRAVAENSRALSGVPGFSSGAIATLLTGQPCARHGRLCLFSARSQGAPRSPLDALAWLRWVPPVIGERGVVRRRLARWLAEREGLTGYVALHRVRPEDFRWLDIPERDDVFESDSIGGWPTFLGDARARSLSVFAARWALAEDTRWEQAFSVLASKRPRLSMLYASELDAVLHQEGPSSRAAEAVLDRLAERVARARDILASDGAQVRTVLVGDHGMGAVRRVIDPSLISERGDLRAFVDSTIVRLWGSERALAAARLAADRARWPARWLSREKLGAWGVGVEGSPWGDAWLQINEGAIFAPSHVGGRVAGMHGYGPDAASSAACFASDAAIDESVVALSSVAGWVRGQTERWS